MGVFGAHTPRVRYCFARFRYSPFLMADHSRFLIAGPRFVIGAHCRPWCDGALLRFPLPHYRGFAAALGLKRFTAPGPKGVGFGVGPSVYGLSAHCRA